MKAQDYLKIGDRVLVVQPEDDYETVWLTGTVVSFENNCVGIQHDKPFPGGHQCRGKATDGFGLWYSHPCDQLQLLAEIVEIEANVSSVFLEEE